MNSKKILLGLTTTTFSSWRDKMIEAEKFNIQEVALFPTVLKPAERTELYTALENSPIRSIPHVHLRGDMPLDELAYLIGRFGTQVFNIHSDNSSHPSSLNYSGFADRVYVENSNIPPSVAEMGKYAGLCVDFSHLENARLNSFTSYDDFWKLFETTKIGCCHVSPFAEKQTDAESLLENSNHWSHDLAEFDYLLKYLKYLPSFISLEVANPFREQLEIKKYLEQLLQLDRAD